MDRKQNILMINMESWDGRMLGCQGFHPAMENATPNINALIPTFTAIMPKGFPVLLTF